MHAGATGLRSRQRGITFVGLVFWGFLIVAGAIIGSKAVPIFIEHQAIHKAAQKAAREGTTVVEVRNIYDRAAAIDDMTSVTARDLEITKENNQVVVSYRYERDIPLFGPAYLVFRFHDSVK
ncbi:MAG: DUF4845 domain-containing protein [Comamonas sp.]